MNRRSFLTKLGIGTVAAAVVPEVLVARERGPVELELSNIDAPSAEHYIRQHGRLIAEEVGRIIRLRSRSLA